jgi:hypothetical protein
MDQIIDHFTVVGAFDTRRQAEAAIEDLRFAGFRPEELGVAGRITTDPTDTDEGFTAGALGGGAIGALAGIALTAGVISPLGPMFAGGLLAGALAGAGVGVITGGTVGALIDMGLSEEEARHYEEELKAGRHLVAVRAEGRMDEAREILRKHGARQPVEPPPLEVTPLPVL